ncbi:uncharacterized protein LOC129888033 [Solanum dulcamara]|uniref:uncharacterized protein LOC129888033 n=1 Tax=Solanum dulcamara TaxID=45834 RepID=UPI0024850053|nr:uncharacterized protein LOC129888033 [Solanum dulcamara]
MAKLYADDFDEANMSALENQLVSYIVDVRDVDERFSDLHGLFATASVERDFSAMKFIKNDLRSQMSDDFFRGLMPYLEKDVFDSISNDVIIKTFQDMKPRRIQL